MKATTLTPTQRNLITNFIDDLGEEDISIYKDYSGRGMFGKNCFGFSLGRYSDSHKMMVNLICFLFDQSPMDHGDTEESDWNEVQDLIELFQNTDSSADSLGLGSILYFPGIAWE